MKLDEIAARTPAGRDRYVDFLRGLSILVVVVGHWFIGMIYWEAGVIGTRSAIGVSSWLWALTWVAQVMPLFFFVGGFSNLVAYESFQRRGDSTLSFLRTRMVRLLKPSLVLVGVWVAIQLILHLTDTGGETSWFLRGVHPPGATVPFGPLWFLAVYAGVILLSPITIRLHRRFGLAVPVVMLAGAIASDAIGFVGGIGQVRWVNVAFIWLLPHQLGHFYADGRFAALSRRTLALMAFGGLAVMVLLTNPWLFGDAGNRWFPGIGHYPKSLLGTDVDPVTNTYPPTFVLVAMTFWSIGVAMLIRDRVSRWLQQARPWKAVVLVNSVIMTLFLWHMTAFLAAILILWPLGLGHASATSPIWWVERPVWLIVPGIFLFGIVALVGRFERPAARPPVREQTGDRL